MKELSERNQTLLLQGAKIEGSFSEGYYHAMEELYIDEAPVLFEFCKWIDKEVGGAGSANIRQLFTCFIERENPTPLQLTYVTALRERIIKLRA